MAKNNGNGTKRARTPKQSLAQMVESGAVKAGQKIGAFYRGIEVTGRIQKDGTVKLGAPLGLAGHYGSLSDAGRAVCVAAGNEKASINGFTFFGTKNADGKVVPVAALRQ